MQIHHYHHQTGEYFGSNEARPDPLDAARHLIPAHATAQQPPAASAGQCAVFSGGAWTTVEDHRGEAAYDTATGEALTITDLGPLPTGVALGSPGAPGECEAWDAGAGAWALDADAWASALTGQLQARLDAADLKAVRPLRAMQAGTGTQDDADRLAALEAYAVALRTMLSDAAFPWTPGNVPWPAEPA